MSERLCTNCFSRISAGIPGCPHCQGSAVSEFTNADAQSVMRGLLDSRSTVRINAAKALGHLHARHAADMLVACALRHPKERDEAISIVDVLRMIDGGNPSIAALHYLAGRHPDVCVKEAARAAIGEESSGSCPSLSTSSGLP